jgi:hypothetical protein
MSELGNLSEIKLRDVLDLFHVREKTGLLTVLSGAARATLRFQKGAILQAFSGSLAGNEAVLDLFGWTEGDLTFSPDESPVSANVTKDMDALIREGTATGVARHKIRQLVPSDQAVFQPTLGPSDDRPRYSVGRTEWQVIRWLDGVRNVREVIEASRVPRREVLRILGEMTEAGFLERVDLHKTLRARVQLPFANFSLVAPQGHADDVAEVDVSFEEEWKRAFRFARGVERVKVRSLGGKSLSLVVSFRPGLAQQICLSRPTLERLALREGDEVGVRPAGSRVGKSRRTWV